MRTLFCASFVACTAALAAADRVEAQIADQAAPFAPSAYDGGHTQPGYPITGQPAYPITGAYPPPEYSAEELLWFRGEYLLWWFKDGDIPPLVTTGSATDPSPGVLGEPGTRVLFGDELDYGSFDGARFTIGGWLDEHRTFGAEVNWFIFDRGREEFAVASPGDPPLTRPLFNVQPGSRDGIPIANPGQRSGQIDIHSESRLAGFEINGLCDPWYDAPSRDSADLHLLYGFRYLDLKEDLAIGSTATALVNLGNAPAGSELLMSEAFDARNRFYGGQVGAQWRAQRGPFSVRLAGKLALGATHQNVHISGQSIVRAPGIGQAAFRGAHLAQPTNIGEYSGTNFSVIPEVGAYVGYEVLEGLSLYAGYTFLYWTDVARPGDQIDEVINLSQRFGGTLVGARRPAFEFDKSDFWAHGLNIGAELTF